MIVIRLLMRNQPVISNFPDHYLSHKPTIRWEFEKPDNRTYTFQVLVKQQGGGTTKFVPAPGTNFYNLYNVKNLYGNLSISIRAFVDGRRYSTSSPIETEIYESAVHRITDTNLLRVAVHADPGDDVFCSFSDNQWHGFDIDMVKLVASELEGRLGLSKRLDIEFTYYSWPKIIGAANQHQVDFAIASISISDKRQRKYGIQFSKPYLTSSLAIISRRTETKEQLALDDNTVTLDDLTDKSVAVHNETTASILMEAFNANNDDRHKIDVHTADSNPELSEWLNDGKIDVVMYDYHRAFSMLEPGMQIQKLVLATETGMDQYGLSFACNNSELREHMDQIIRTNKMKLRNMLEERIEHRRLAI